jgi:membrane protease YdiL (CAAX protease family)
MIVGISLAIVATKSLDLIVKAKVKLFVNKLSLLVSIILIFICFFLPYTFISGTFDKIRYYSVYDKNLLRLLLNGLISLIYHAAYEEYLFRGLLISGLLYLNIEKWKINIIQATIFGLMHIYQSKLWH